MKIEEHYPLQEIHTFHLPVKTRYYVEYDNIDELCSFLSESPLLEQYPCYHMGGGSNLLFLHDYPGVILHSAIRFIEQVSENGDSLVLRAGAGVVWDDFVKYCVENNWGGVENLSLIPGEVGASAVQNIGAYGVEVKDVIEKVETIDIHTRQPRIFTNEECKYGYRDSIFKNEYRGQYIVTAVQYRLQKNATFHLDYGNLREAVARCSNPTLADVRRVVIEIRRSKLPDPDETGNAGSFFKNPVVPKAHYERLKKRYPDCKTYTDGEQFLADKDVELVSVAVRSPQHIDYAIRALEAGKYVLQHPAAFPFPLARWRKDTENLQAALAHFPGLEVIPSRTTFFLVRLKEGRAADLKRYLLDEHRLLIRDASNFRGLDEAYFRLSTQSPEVNTCLFQALKLWFAQDKT